MALINKKTRQPTRDRDKDESNFVSISARHYKRMKERLHGAGKPIIF